MSRASQNMDLSRWLKDEIGLIQMSEIDLNSLMFHPRHGSLCRRLVKFLAESTLCHERYPNVYASEEYSEAICDLERTNNNLLEVLKNLNHTAKDHENQERELVFLQSKSEHLRILEELQQVSMAALKEMENRNNLGIEQLAQRIEEIDYLSNSSLEALYALPDLSKVTSTIITRQMTTVDEELNTSTTKVENMIYKINGILQLIEGKMDNVVELEPRLRKTSFQNLIALKKPEFVEIRVNEDEEEKRLYDKNLDLMRRVASADQEVSRLKEIYILKKNNINRDYKDQLDKCLCILRDLRAVEISAANSFN